MKQLFHLIGVVGLLGLPRLLLADPLVAPDNKPGVATGWSSGAKGTTLTIAEGFSSETVAQAIGQRVPGATAKAEGQTVVVSGVGEAALLAALQKIDVGSDEDIAAMLATMEGGNDDGSGSSIRATKAADFSDVLGDTQTLLTAKVLKVKRTQYPLVMLTLKIQKAPKGAAIKSGSTVQVVPRVKSKKGIINPDDKVSKLNVGAWYVQPGDIVRVRLDGEPKDDVWIAEAFERVGPK